MSSDLEYGAVIITKGERAGQLVYYDDGEGRRAIVYLGAPFLSPVVLLPHSCLSNITALEQERFKRDNPELCRVAGVD